MTLMILTILTATDPTGGNAPLLSGKNIALRRTYILLEVMAKSVFAPMDSGVWNPSMTGSYMDRPR